MRGTKKKQSREFKLRRAQYSVVRHKKGDNESERVNSLD